MKVKNILFTYNDVQKEVANGRALLIYERKVYDVTNWRFSHPGGELVIRHMLGRDATDQILTNHSPEVLKRYMKCFEVGSMDMADTETSQFVDKPLSLEFRRLHKKVTDLGLFETNPFYYAVLYTLIISYFLVAFGVLYNFGDTIWGCTVSGVFLAIFWHQSAGIMHDTGHNSITKNRNVDTVVGLVFTNCFTGVSIMWWKTSHFVHHLVTNDPENDPHIQMLPFIAITTRFFESLYSTYHERILPFDNFAKTMVQVQHLVYIPLMSLARFVMYKDSFVYISRKKHLWKTELVLILIFWTYFFTMIFTLIQSPWLRLYYFFLPNLLHVILLLQLYVSHNHMTTDQMQPAEDYAAYQLRTTIDFYSPELLDFVHAGLQFQIAHHFFPRMPRHNLRKATKHLVDFCRATGLVYTQMGFIEGNIKLLKHLRIIAEEAYKFKPQP